MILKGFIAVFVLLLVGALDVFSQQMNADTLSINLRPENYKNPKKATLLSATLPGAGQVYNGKAWKIPILYGGFATNIYFIDFNNQRYQALREALFQFDKKEPNNFPSLNRDGLVRQVNFWRRNRDLNYFLFIGIYALNIIDAQVDAHLSTFDVSDDLSFRFEPSFETLTAGGTLFGLSMKINF
jgi:hypothetical protein